MSTALAQQLHQLQVARATSDHRPRGKPSLVFTPQEAADLDAETILELATHGLQQLLRLDGRFQRFQSTLFAPATTALDRSQLTREENESKDVEIGAFLLALAPHFLHPAAFKVLEYLVRVYSAHERNVGALVSTFLPFHQTPEFVRVVQLCHLEGSIWSFLKGMHSTGATLPRAALVDRCVRDRAVLDAVCAAAQAQGRPDCNSALFQSFFAVLLAEVIATAPRMGEDAIQALVPVLTQGLSRESSEDHRAACFVAFGALCSRVPLEPSVAGALLAAACAGAGAALAPQAAMLACVVAHTQRGMRELPDPAFRALVRLPGFATELAGLAKRGANVAELVGLLTPALVRGAVQRHECQTLLRDIIDALPLPPAQATDLAWQLLSAAADAAQSDARAIDTTGALASLVWAMDRRHPDALDQAITRALRGQAGAKGRASTDAPDASDSGTDSDTESDSDVGPGAGVGGVGQAKADGGALPAAAAAQVSSFLTAALSGSPRAPLAGSHVTLAQAADGPNAELRRRAMVALDEAARDGKGGNEDGAKGGDRGGDGRTDGVHLPAYVSALVLRRIRDDDPAVVIAALSTNACASLPAASLGPEVESALRMRLSAAITRKPGKGANVDGWRGACKRMVKALGRAVREAVAESGVGAAERDWVQSVVGCLMGVMGAEGGSSARKLAVAAAEACAGTGLPVFGGLRGVGERYEAMRSAKSGDGEPGSSGKAPKREKGEKKKGKKSKERAVAEDAGGEKGRKGAVGDSDSDGTSVGAVIAEGIASGVVADPEGGAALLSRAAGRGGARAAAVAAGALAVAAERLPAGAAVRASCLSAAAEAVRGKWGVMEWLGREDRPAPHAAGSDVSLPDPGAAAALSSALSRCLRACEDGESLRSSVSTRLLVFTECAAFGGTDALLRDASRVSGTRPSPLSALGFLTAVAGLAPGDGLAPGADGTGIANNGDGLPGFVRARALVLAVEAVRACPNWASQGGNSDGDMTGVSGARLLARVLGALADDDRGVRASAVGLLEAMATGAGTEKDGPGAEAAVRGLARMLAAEARGMAGDGAAVVASLRRALAMEGGQGKKRKGLSGEDRKATVGVLADALSQVPETASDAAGARAVLAAMVGDGGAEAGAGAARASVLGACAGVAACVDLAGRAGSDGRVASAAGPLTLSWATASGSARLASYCIAMLGSLAEYGDGGTGAEWDGEVAAAGVRAVLAGLRAGLGAKGAGVGGDADTVTPSADEVVVTPSGDAGAKAVASALGDVRAAAAAAVTPPLFAALPEEQRHKVLCALLRSATTDWHDAGARGARHALSRVPLRASDVIGLMRRALGGSGSAGVESTRATKRGRRGAAEGASGSGVGYEAAVRSRAGMEALIGALEVLQGAERVEGEAEVVREVCEVLTAVLGAWGAGGGDGEGGVGVAVGMGPYAAQLALQALRGAVERGGEAGARVDVAVAVAAARGAMDPATRNAALELLGALARARPEDTLGHTLEVLSVVGASAQATDDSHSHAVAAAALRALAPAWVASGRSMGDLVGAIVGQLPSVSAHRRSALVEALVGAVGVEEGLPAVAGALIARDVGAGAEGDEEWGVELAREAMDDADGPARIRALTRLLQTTSESHEDLSAPVVRVTAAFAADALRDMAGRGARAAAASIVERGAATADASLQSAYSGLIRQVLSTLQAAGAQAHRCAKKRQPVQAHQALADALHDCLESLQLLMDAAAFLRAAAELAASRDAQICRRALRLFTRRVVALSGAAEEERRAAEAALLTRAERRAKEEALCEAALGVLGTLREVMAGGVRPGRMVAGGGADTTAESAPGSLAAVDSGFGERSAKDAATVQAALLAMDAIAKRFGAEHGARMGEVAAAAAACARDARPGVRGSALVALAATLLAARGKVVTVVPTAADAAMAAAEEAIGALSGDGTGADKAAAGTDKGATVAATEGSYSLALASALAAMGALVDALPQFVSPYLGRLLGVALHPAVLGRSADGCADLASRIRHSVCALVAPRHVVPSLAGAFDTCLARGAQPASLALHMLADVLANADSDTVAGLLDPSFALILRGLDVPRAPPQSMISSQSGTSQPQSNRDLGVGMGSTSQSGTTPSRPRSLKKVHGPADSTFIADSTIGLAVSGTALAVEAGAVRAFVELTMKLPERKFKPMFLRLTEWAGARVGPAEGGVGDGGGGSEYGAAAVSPARQAAMFAVAVALSARLRAVFVPYYSYLWDSILFALTGADRGVGGAKGGGMKSAKRRKAEHPVAGSDHLTTGAGGSAVDGAGGGAGADGSGVDHVWRLRFRALRALLGCLLSDSVGFVTAERAGVVAPGVVLQLGEELPEHLRGELADDGTSAFIRESAPECTAPIPDGFAAAAVEAAMQLAVSMPDDATRKPLVHKCLMATRSVLKRPRVLGIECVARIADRLRDEFLVFIPECVPFLSELLEDPEFEVERRAQEAVRQLEGISGESLEPYLKT